MDSKKAPQWAHDVLDALANIRHTGYLKFEYQDGGIHKRYEVLTRYEDKDEIISALVNNTSNTIDTSK